MKKQHGFLFLIIWITAFVFQSCGKEPVKSNIVVCFGGNKMAILCEGNFMWGNARMDLFLRDSGTCISNVFEKANNKPLGDILQSGWYTGSSIWLSINNSGNVIQIDANSFKQRKIKTGLGSPRYLLESGKYLFVSDLYNNKITVLDTGNLSIIKQFSVVSNPKTNTQGWSEHMVNWGSYVAVSLMGGGVKLIDPLTLKTDSILTDTGANRLAVDSDNHLWVLTQNGKIGKLTAFDSDKKMVKQFSFNCPLGASKLVTTSFKTGLLLIVNNQVVQISTTANDWSESKVVFKDCRTAYGLGVDPISGHIFVADAKDYVSNGTITELDANGTAIRQFSTGVNPSEFIFY